jgi:hypothetical protein
MARRGGEWEWCGAECCGSGAGYYAGLMRGKEVVCFGYGVENWQKGRKREKRSRSS